MLLGVLGLALGLVGAILQYPILQAVLAFAASVIGFLFLTLLLRVWLEAFMVVFRMAEHVREVNEKLSADSE